MTVGRLVLPALRWRPETGFSHEDGAIDAALEGGVGGFIVFGVGGARADEIAELTRLLRYRAGRPLLIGADLERGAAQQGRRLTHVPPPGALASLADESVFGWAARITAREARTIGVNWVFAPVADLDLEPENPIVQTRSFGADPAAVSAAVTAWIHACQAEGVLACVKHFPGHGRTRVDSHDRIPVVEADPALLSRTDLVPFAAAVRAGVAAVMTAHVAFPGWDPSGAPATRSPIILGHLREALGFAGLVVTDALIMEGALQGVAADQAMLAPIQAGCDLLLYPPDPVAAIRAIERRAASNESFTARVTASLGRYDAALTSAAREGDGVIPVRDDAAASIAARLLAAGLVRGTEPSLQGGVDLTVVDDDVGGWYPPGPSDLVERALARQGVYRRHGAGRVVLAFSEPRAAKGRVGFGPTARRLLEAHAPGAALVVLFAHPRLVTEIPGGAPVLVAWHRQPLMQEAVGRWLMERLA